MQLSDLIGFTGVAILLIAFLLNLLGKLSTSTILYSALNSIGAALACTASIMINYLPFIILEGAWTIVSIVSLTGKLTKKK